jgi:hypothetical protein
MYLNLYKNAVIDEIFLITNKQKITYKTIHIMKNEKKATDLLLKTGHLDVP